MWIGKRITEEIVVSGGEPKITHIQTTDIETEEDLEIEDLEFDPGLSIVLGIGADIILLGRKLEPLEVVSLRPLKNLGDLQEKAEKSWEEGDFVVAVLPRDPEVVKEGYILGYEDGYSEAIKF